MKACMRILGLGLLLVAAACAASAMSIQEAKQLPDTDHVTLSGKVVTYTGAGFFYIEEDSRCMGIRVEKAVYELTVGMRANIDGHMATKDDSKERYILADSADPAAPLDPNDAVAPVSMSGKALGGGDWSVVGTGGQQGISNARGLNNIGLLVKTWGQFHLVDATTFTVDDGVGLSVRCTVPSGTFLSSTWQNVIVTGISSMSYLNASYQPLLVVPVDGVAVITPVEAVSTPGTPSGDTTPLVGLSYGYSTTGSTCSQGHPVEYSFNWGDGSSSSPWSTSTTATHVWTTTGAKTVTVTARCHTHTGVTATSAGRQVTPVTLLANAPWPMFRHDFKHSGVSPYHDSVPYGSVWSLSIGDGISSPAIGPDGTIYIGGNDSAALPPVPYLYALNCDGSLKWRSPINLNTRSSPAIGSDGRIYIGGSGLLYCFDSAGSQKWTYPLDADVTSSPAIGPDGTVYIATMGSYLYALTPGPSSATRKWYANIGKMNVTSPCISTDGSIVYAAGGNYIYALDASNGATKWSYNFGTATTSSCALDPDRTALYIGSGNNYLYSFSTASTLGNVIVNWSTQIDFTQSVTSSSPAIGPDGTIYLSSNYGTLYAFNPSDGSQKWTFDSGASDIRSSAALNADGTLILASYDGYVRGLDSATGAERWHYLLPGTLYTSPAIAANGTIVIANMGGVIFGNIGGVRPSPVAPSNLTVTSTSDTSVNLSWSDNSSDEYGFRIEKRRGTTGAWTVIPRANGGIPTVNTGITTYADSSLQTGQAYYYRVCAYGPGGDSAYSNEANIIMPGIETPADALATAISTTQVDLTWTDRSPGEQGFKIERMLGPNGLFEEIGQVGAGITYYSDLTVYPGFNYYYRVKSYDATRVSTGSDEAWALTAPLTPTGSLAPITTGNTTRKQIALTFDAGFPPIWPTISTNLKNALAYSTFFITGQATEYDNLHIAQLATDGMNVCNHTYTHPNLRYCSDADIAHQFDTTDDIIYAKTNTLTSNPSHTRSFFRAPYGAVNQHVYDAAAADGYRSVYWTKDSGDSAGASAAIVRSNAKAGAANGAIILFHCTMATTRDAVPGVISDLQGLNYELVTVPEVIAPTQVTSPSGHLVAGWNLMSVPIDPALGFPHIVFRGLTIDNVGGVSPHLKRWNRGTGLDAGAENIYTTANPKTFGNIDADAAYWVYLSSSTTLKINGAAATTDRHIRLQYTTTTTDLGHPTYGLVGYPFQTSQSFGNCRVYNPNAEAPKTRSVADAMAVHWIPDTFYGYTPGTTPTEYNVTTSSLLEPWHGYRGACLQPDCELIIPHL